MKNMNMFKKIGAAMLTFVLMSQSFLSVSAKTQVSVSYDAENEAINVSVDTDKLAKTAVLTVEKDGIFYAVAEFERTSADVFKYTCDLPDYCKSGRYVAKVTIGGESDTAEFDHINKGLAAEAMISVNGATTPETLDAALKEVGSSIAVDYDEFIAYQNPLADIYFFYKPQGDMTSAEFSVIYGTALAISKIANAPDAATAEALLSTNADKIGFDYAAYTQLEEGEKNEILQRFFQWENTESTLDTQFSRWFVLADINNNRDNSVTAYRDAMFETHKSVLALDLTEYNNCADKDAVIRIMMSDTYDTVSELRTAFAAAVSSVGPQLGGSGGGFVSGGGSSSGGGGGSAGGSMVNWSPDVMDTKPQTEPVVAANPFADVADNHWCKEPITALYAKNVIDGIDAAHFAPDAKVTRAQFAKMVVNALFADDAVIQGAEFEDVLPGAWYYDSVSKAAGLGLINGVDNANFAPDATVSRQDAALILYRALLRQGVSMQQSGISFADGAEISEYAYQAVASLVKAGILSGMENGSFEPFGNLTRAQAAKMLYEAINMIS